MASRILALWRGINVGKAKRIAMADLKKVLEALGASDVKTLLNSGNAAFTLSRKASGDLGMRIEKAVLDATGVSARVTVIEQSDLDEILAANPLRSAETDASRFMIAFPRTAVARRQLTEFATEDWSPDEVAIGENAAYLWCKRGILESKMLTALTKRMGEDVTTRNFATLTKLATA